MKAVFSILLVFSIILSPKSTFGQCTWSSYDFDSFEYSTAIPHLIPGTIYQSNPQTFAGCIRTGSKGMYMNIVNGFAGILYSRPYTSLCIGKQYRFSFSIRDAFSSSGNLTFNIYDGNNLLLHTLTVGTNSVWQDITMPSFTALTSTVRFEIITNLPGGPGNDVGFDDLKLSTCNQAPFTTSLSQCFSGTSQDLFGLISGSNLSQNGIWTGASTLQNGAMGTFNQNVNSNGTYTYSISAGPNCPDSIATVAVNIVQTPNISAFIPIVACSSAVLPSITGANLSGQQKYYTQPNGGGQVVNSGSIITTSQTLYAFDGLTGCSDQEILQIIIDAPVSAGNDNAASYCGPGQVLQMNSFLSTSANLTGVWAETTQPISGALNTSTGEWNSSNVAPGNYLFTYTVAANGACGGDVANFLINIGNMQDVDLGNDTTLCTGQTMWLNAGTYQSYLWNNGSTNATKYVNSPGTYSVKVGTMGPNQIVNGDFEQGAVGFTTSYAPGSGGTWGLLSNAGTYAVSSSGNLVHTNFPGSQDVTAGAGVNMLIVNGSSTPNTSVWCQTIPVQPNTTYQFGTWAASPANTTGPNAAQLQFSINGATLGSIFSPLTSAGTWSQFNQNWSSGMTTTAQICIVNQNINQGDNDFMLDEISFKPVCYKYDTIIVNYAPNPTVNLGLDQNLCHGEVATLDASNSGSAYAWNNGDSTQIIQITTSGTYDVIVTTPSGCIGTDAITVNFEMPKNAGADSLVQLCSTQNFFGLNSVLQSGSTLNGSWSSNDFPGSLSSNGDVTLTGSTGTYHFNYLVEGTYCPNDTSVMTMSIVEQPVAAISVNLHFCNELNSVEDLSLYANQSNQPYGGYWLADSNVPVASFDTNSAILSTGSMDHGMYTINYILQAENPCVQDTFELIVQITQVPEINFTSDLTAGCQPLTVVFENTSGALGNLEYQWDFGNGQTSNSANGSSIDYLDAMCYDVSLTITADNLCTSSYLSTDMICAYQLPTAKFTYGPQQVFSDGPTVLFENNSTGNLYNYWSFGDGTTAESINPQHDYPLGEIGNYIVNLMVETEHGCLDSVSQIVQVKDQLIYYVPNSFTPDNNTFNNEFVPVLTAGFDLLNYNLEIYNRWGEKVFHSLEYEKGWNGTVDGINVQDGMYTWKIVVGLLENDENMEIIGHVNLLR